MSKIANLYLFLSGILRNHSITPLVSFHWLILRESLSWWFILSRMFLLIRPISFFAGLISFTLGLFLKFGLWSLYLGLCQISEMTTFMGVVECISPPMCDNHWWAIQNTQIHWWIPYIKAIHYVCGIPFQIPGNASDIRNLFIRLGLAVLQKHLTDDYR